jgi:hypothetical protein
MPVRPRGIGGENTGWQVIDVVMMGRRVVMPVRETVTLWSVLMHLPPGDTAQNQPEKRQYPKQPRRAAANPRKLRACSQNIHEISMAERLRLRQRMRSRWLTRPHRSSTTECDPRPSFL